MSWHRAPRDILPSVARWVVPAWLVLPTSALLPAVDLTGLVALLALAFSDSAKGAMPYIVIAYIVLIVSRDGVDRRQRLREAAAMTLAMVLFLGAGAWFNERLVKPAFASPRPDIVELSNRGVLPISPTRFYEIGSKGERRQYLANVFSESQGAALRLSPQVRQHWLEETGYSFPSGHSSASMLVATFFLCVGGATLRGRRALALVPLLPWALFVCVSRPVLRVHRPLDITLGAVQGTIIGVCAFLFVWALARPRPAQSDGHAVAATT